MKQKKKQSKIMEQTMESISDYGRAPKGVFIALVLLYIASTVLTSFSAGIKDGAVNLFGTQIPMYSFTGIFSALSNICVIFLAVYCGKAGFVSAITLTSVAMVSVLMGIIVQGNVTSIPGLFGNTLTIIAIVVIRINSVRAEKASDELRYRAVTDPLTGLPNSFACTQLLLELGQHEDKFAVVSIDINGFKSINDTMGFSVGNEVLVKVANFWKNIADSENAETLDYVARLNGDEFLLVIRNYESEKDVLRTIKKYEAALNDRLYVGEYDFFVSASFGYAEFPTDARDFDSLATASGAAMREIKRRGSSEHILRFTPDLIKDEKNLEVESKIMNALEQDTIIFYLQPQYDMDHKLRGFEALARMKDADGNLVSPGEFIPVAEKVGLIDKIDGAVFRKSAAFVSKLIKETGADITLSINVSVRHLMKSDFFEEITDLIKNSKIPPEKLEIEITESIMIDSAAKALECIDKIKEMGVKLAIDDFGTGYSSLSYLHRLPANLLKIDKSFIDKMNESESSKQYVAAVIQIGHIMGFEVISEGVEEQEQLDTLREINCDDIQGFVWGRPLPPEEAAKLVKN